MEAKEAAARKAVESVRDGMVLGLGSGTTATFAIEAIGERVRQEGLRIRAVATSGRSRALAEKLGIPLIDPGDVDAIDLTIDGADEIDPGLHLIKGGGGALVREKIVAAASRELLIICDESKLVPVLGAFPLPVAVFPFGREFTQRRLEEQGARVTLRLGAEPDIPYVTDDGLHILDIHLGAIPDPPATLASLRQVVGLAEVGLFVGLAHRVIIGFADGHTEERRRP